MSAEGKEVILVPHRFRRNGNWQGALPILPFLWFLVLADSRHSGIDTGMFPGMHWNRMQPEWFYWNILYYYD